MAIVVLPSVGIASMVSRLLIFNVPQLYRVGPSDAMMNGDVLLQLYPTQTNMRH